jgi:hypothetical protein
LTIFRDPGRPRTHNSRGLVRISASSIFRQLRLDSLEFFIAQVDLNSRSGNQATRQTEVPRRSRTGMLPAGGTGTVASDPLPDDAGQVIATKP